VESFPAAVPTSAISPAPSVPATAAATLSSTAPDPAAAPTPQDPISLARESLGTTAPLDTPGLASILMARLNNINIYLAKPAIRKLGFAKDVEFGVLIQVYLMGRPNKKELCRQLLIGDSTGVEVTRRLARKGYLRETVDPNDRRASRLSVTEKGQRMLKEGSHLFYTIHREFLTPLSPEEQLSLVGLLTRLHNFHSGRLYSPGART